MAKIPVIAKVTGTHALSDMYLEQGKQYSIDEELVGDNVFERVSPEQKPSARGKSAAPDKEEV